MSSHQYILGSEGVLQLIRPNRMYKHSYLRAQAEGEFGPEGKKVSWFNAGRTIDAMAEDPVRQVFWLVNGKDFLGELSVTCLDTTAGITFYSVRESQRGRGFATVMLRLALAHLKALGFSDANLLIDRENLASIRAAERNGAIAEANKLGNLIHFDIKLV